MKKFFVKLKSIVSLDFLCLVASFLLGYSLPSFHSEFGPEILAANVAIYLVLYVFVFNPCVGRQV